MLLLACEQAERKINHQQPDGHDLQTPAKRIVVSIPTDWDGIVRGYERFLARPRSPQSPRCLNSRGRMSSESRKR